MKCFAVLTCVCCLTLALGGVAAAQNLPAPEMRAMPGTTAPLGNEPGATYAGVDLTALSGVTSYSPVADITLSPYLISKYFVTHQDVLDVLNWALDQGYLYDDDGVEWSQSTIWESQSLDYDTSPAGSNVRSAEGFLLVNMGKLPAEGWQHYFSKYDYDGSQFVLKEFDPDLEIDVSNVDYSDLPAAYTTWFFGAMYCNWLSAQHGLDPVYDPATFEVNSSKANGFPNGFRLPTWAELSAACFWDPVAETSYLFGVSSDTIGKTKAVYGCHDGMNNADDDNDGPDGAASNPLDWPETPSSQYAWGDPEFHSLQPRLAPVGFYNGVNTIKDGTQTVDSSSPIGCYDMAGQLNTWCHDLAESDGSVTWPPETLTDPTGADFADWAEEDVNAQLRIYQQGSFWRGAIRNHAGFPPDPQNPWMHWDSMGIRLASNGAGDMDSDGLTDFEDVSNGASPYLTDTDEDGLTDAEEVDDHQTDPADEDTDGDGFDDYTEVGAGSDPKDPESTPEDFVPVAGALGLAALAGLLAGGMALRKRRG